jgi:hypothetical protein
VEFVLNPESLEVFRYEDGLEEVIKRFDLHCPRNPVNVGNLKYKARAVNELSELGKELIAKWYRDDFVEFGY